MIALASGTLGGLSPTQLLAQPLQGTSSADQRQLATRTVTFTVPFVYRQSVLGDVMLEVSNGKDVKIETTSLKGAIESLLNDKGVLTFDTATVGREYISAEELAAAGFTIRFDSNRLELVMDAIDGDLRPVGTLGRDIYSPGDVNLATVEPAGFSAYLNVNTNLDYTNTDGMAKPEVFVFGATRFNNVVVELDGALSNQFNDSYRFYLRSARAVYDFPDKHRRASAGDLRLNTIPLLRTPFIGGVALEKRREIFSPFLPASRLGGQEIFLDNRSTVDVLINGAQYDSFQLDAGRYDLANLPLQAGSNDIELIIRDSAGRQQRLNLNYFFEPLDLAPGEDEYVLGAGVLARNLNFEPDYTNDPAIIGHYRRALSENLVLGGAMEVSDARQTIAAEATVVPQVFPGIFDLQLAASHGQDLGVAGRMTYRLRSGSSFANRKQLSITVDYESSKYRTLGDFISSDFDLLSVSGSYSQAFSERTFVSAGVTHTRTNGPQGNRSLAFMDIIFRMSERFRIVSGLEYGNDRFSSTNFGVRVGLSYIFGGDYRGNADYRSRLGSARLGISKNSDNSVGSVGWDVSLNRDTDSAGADASLDYIANRFDARLSVFADGDSLDNLTQRQRARFQVGTSIAYADGTFGIGRPISDAFAVVAPHRSLEGRKVISGRDLADNEYYARSGTLGAAVQSDLASYSLQNVQFDVDGLEPGYDVGDGLVRVDPPFRSGYKVVVGNDRFVSAVGTLNFGEEPASLVSGTITSTDDEGFEAVPFFTNSLGRFGIIGLAPGKTYRITLRSEDRIFEITVPSDNTGLFRIGELKLAPKEN